MKIGVLSESFRLPMLQAVDQAAALGLDGLQIYAVGEELDCGRCNPGTVRELRRHIESKGLCVSAVCGDLGGHGFAIEQDNPAKIETSRRIVDLALELSTHVITTHIGVIPQDTGCRRYAVMQQACARLSEYAKSVGAVFAIETGPEKAETLRRFLDSLPQGGIGVNMDPANLVMVTDDDPVQAVRTLAPYIVHTHAKDGRRLRPSDPQTVYDFFAEGGIGDLRLEEYFIETPLGGGDVDFPAYLNALREIGYDGFLTIEREVGKDPAADILHARDFLRQYL